MKYTISIDIELPQNMDSTEAQVATSIASDVMEAIPDGVSVTSVMVYQGDNS